MTVVVIVIPCVHSSAVMAGQGGGVARVARVVYWPGWCTGQGGVDVVIFFDRGTTCQLH